MTQIVGPGYAITKAVPVTVTCKECGDEHQHIAQVFDEDAYWNLDWYGEPAPMTEPMNLYAKVWFPTIRQAQARFEEQRLARIAERAQQARGRVATRRKAKAGA